MSFTDLFIRRPVLAIVVNLLLILLGSIAFNQLEDREYPKVEDSQLLVRTVYPGASAALVQSYVTAPLQEVLSVTRGADYITSSSTDSLSLIYINLKSGYDINAAMAEITSIIAPIKNQFPAEVEYPVITKTGQDARASIYLQVSSNEFSSEQITEYLERVIKPELQTSPAIGQIKIWGARVFSMRLWLDPLKLAAFNVTADEFKTAINKNSFLTAAGEIESELTATAVSAETDLRSVDEFKNIIVREDGDQLIRVKDLATVELAAEDTNTSIFFNGEKGLAVAVSSAPGESPLAVSNAVQEKLEKLRPQLPGDLFIDINFDTADTIRDSMQQVNKTIIEAAVIVLLVVFLFLGDVRSVIIPIIAIPLSLIGNVFIMWALGYSLNLFTLLSMVLAIGLVVDDAIVVVENIHRHIDRGMTTMRAALIGAREIAMPVISMTLTLAAVYAPMGFIAGMTGQLVREFVYTLAGAVFLSGFVALTLSPMMCSRLLRSGHSNRYSRWLDDRFDSLQKNYKRWLTSTMEQRSVIIVMLIAFMCAIPFMVLTSKSELVPPEDLNFINGLAWPPQTTNVEYLEKESKAIDDIFFNIPEYGGSSFRFLNVFDNGGSMSAMKTVPWYERDRSVFEILTEVTEKVQKIPGLQINPFVFNRVPGSMGGLPVEFVIQTTQGYRILAPLADEILSAALGSGLFIVGYSDLKFEKPELSITIDRDKAAQLGIGMDKISSTLSILLGEGEIGRFTLYGNNYKIIPQAADSARLNSSWINRYYVKTSSGDSVPLSTVIDTQISGQPQFLNQFQQQNSVQLSLAPHPSVSLGEALDFLDLKAREILPEGFSVNYQGDARKFKQEGNSLYITFFLALLTIYLVLAAQFESFRDPFIILTTVPVSIAGALIFLMLGFGTLNIYTQVSLITLIGLISKHGILIVEFANKLQGEGYSRMEAAVQSAAIRLRPILMTTAAMVLGVLPLLLSQGPGSAGRFQIGLVITAGMLVGTLCTLFVVPVIYSYLAREHSKVHFPQGATAL